MNLHHVYYSSVAFCCLELFFRQLSSFFEDLVLFHACCGSFMLINVLAIPTRLIIIINTVIDIDIDIADSVLEQT